MATSVRARGSDIDVSRVTGHSGVEGNEQACQHARAATESFCMKRGGATTRGGFVSLASLKARRTAKATEEWRRDIRTRNRGKRLFRNPPSGVKPCARDELRRAPKEVSSRFFQLGSGHAMLAPFLKDKLRLTDSNLCWWCGIARQTREHLFKECRAWKEEVATLWKEIGEISDRISKAREGEKSVRTTGSVYKGKKGFGFGVRARLGNTTIRELFGRNIRVLWSISSCLRRWGQ